jgi:hypothetical protein
VQVLSAPAVLAMEKTLGASGSGLMAELTCTIAGDPRPKVRLYLKVKKTHLLPAQGA